MLEGGKISSRQFIYILLFTVLGTTYFFLPGITAAYAGRDFWMTPVIATVPGIAVILVITALHSMYPGLSIIQYSEQILGKVAGKITGGVFVFWLIHVNSIIIQEFGEFMNVAFMPETPTVVFSGLITLLCGVALFYGLELVARLAEFLFPVLLALAMVILALAASNFSLAEITPVLSNGVLPVLAGSMPPAAWRGEVVLAAMLLPFLNKPEQGCRAGIYAVILIGFLLFLNAIEVAGVYGEETGRLVFPVLKMVRDIDILDFFQRIEVLLMAAWISGLFVKVAVFYYCAALALAQLAGLSSYRPLITPMGVLLVSMAAYNFRNIYELAGFISTLWPFYGLSVELLLPLFLLIVALLTGKKRRSGQQLLQKDA